MLLYGVDLAYPKTRQSRKRLILLETLLETVIYLLVTIIIE